MRRPEREQQNDVLAPDFTDFIAALRAHDVDYVLVGGSEAGSEAGRQTRTVTLSAMAGALES